MNVVSLGSQALRMALAVKCTMRLIVDLGGGSAGGTPPWLAGTA